MRNTGAVAPRPPAPVDLTRPLIGLVLLAFGIVFLLDSAGALNADRTIDRWWPTIPIAIGVFQLLERPASRFVALLLIGVGTALLMFTTDVLAGDPGPYVGPLILIAIGLMIIGRWSSRRGPIAAGGDDVIRGAGIFGGPELVTTSQHFHGAALTALFGGVTLDLRSARPVESGASVTATAVFGGIEDKTDRSEPPADDVPVLNVDAMAVFGGVEIKHEK